MRIDVAILTLLRADAGVTKLVGDPPNTRIFVSREPEGEVDAYATMEFFGDDQEYHMSGPSLLAEELFDVTGWGKTSDDARAISDAVKVCLSGFPTNPNAVVTDPTTPASTLEVQGIFLQAGGGGSGYDDVQERYSHTRTYKVKFTNPDDGPPV